MAVRSGRAAIRADDFVIAVNEIAANAVRTGRGRRGEQQVTAGLPGLRPHPAQRAQGAAGGRRGCGGGGLPAGRR